MHSHNHTLPASSAHAFANAYIQSQKKHIYIYIYIYIYKHTHTHMYIYIYIADTRSKNLHPKPHNTHTFPQAETHSRALLLCLTASQNSSKVANRMRTKHPIRDRFHVLTSIRGTGMEYFLNMRFWAICMSDKVILSCVVTFISQAYTPDSTSIHAWSIYALACGHGRTQRLWHALKIMLTQSTLTQMFGMSSSNQWNECLYTQSLCEACHKSACGLAWHKSSCVTWAFVHKINTYGHEPVCELEYNAKSDAGTKRCKCGLCISKLYKVQR